MTENDRAQEYAGRLAKMIQCATVSVKNSFDDTEFKKLRGVVKNLFPLFHEKAEYKIYGDDCWVYLLKGKRHDKRIMLMSHHDVAPALGEWEHPAFSGEIVQGKIWGRGTVDTKGSLFAEFQALEEMLESGFEPECDVYLASSCNEEIAGNGIPLAVADFTKQGLFFDLVLDEGGAVLDPPLPGIKQKCAMIAVHEKGRCVLNCTASTGEAHAGLSGNKETPVVRMAKFITEIATKPPFITRLYPSVRAMFEGLAPKMQFPYKLIFKNLWCFAPLLLRLMPKMSPQAAALVGTACSFTKIESKEMDDGGKTCVAKANLRYVDDKDFENDLSEFKKIAAGYGIEIEADPEEPNEWHRPADMTKKAFSQVMRIVGETFPKVAASPMLLPAGTDSRHFSDICPCVLRFAPIIIDKQQFASVHSPNENIDVASLPTAVDFYKNILKNISSIVE